MICPKCGTNNPNFFIKCVECGTKLPKGTTPEERKKQQMLLYGGICLVAAVALAAVIINMPAIGAWIFSLPAFFSAVPVGTVPQTTQLSLNEPGRYGDIQITVTRTREGGISFNNQKFYTVLADIRNFQTRNPAHFISNDFPLIDSRGEQYLPAGIGDGITLDVQPGTTESVELRYIIPKDAAGLKLRIDAGRSSGNVAGTYLDFKL